MIVRTVTTFSGEKEFTGRADLHIHTSHSSHGTTTVCAVLEHARANTDLDVIAITDHDTVDGALEALKWGSIYGVQVVPGIATSTIDGDLLVGAEYYNASLSLLGANRISSTLSRQLGFGEIANPDAHILPVIGCGTTISSGETSDDLRQVLLVRSTCALQHPRPRNFISLC